MGALLNHLPLAADVFSRDEPERCNDPAQAQRSWDWAWGALLAPMNSSVGASVATLGRTVFPRLDAAGMAAEKSAALVCVASEHAGRRGTAIARADPAFPDAMMRAHTEGAQRNRCGSAHHQYAGRVLAGALVPAAILRAMYVVVTWGMRQRKMEIRARRNVSTLRLPNGLLPAQRQRSLPAC